jgi:hypothetical protein
MKRVLLGLGVCALGLIITGTASADWHRPARAPRRAVVVSPRVYVQPVVVRTTTVVVRPTIYPYYAPAFPIVSRFVRPWR